LAILDLALVIFVIFFERKKPTSAVAWALALIFLPYIGAFFYITFGIRPRFNRFRRYKEKNKTDIGYYQEQLKNLSMLGGDAILEEDREAVACQDLINLNIMGSQSIYTKGNDIQVYTNGKEKFTALLSDLRAAESSIHLVYFIYRNDDLGKIILKILTEKAKAGVTVRCLLDDIGTWMTPKKHFFKPLLEAGGQVAFFSPARIVSLINVNYRNHRKLAIIDGEVGYLGGMNVGLEYLGIGRKNISDWRDTHMRITGPSVYMMQLRFLMDWQYSRSEMVDYDEMLFPPLTQESKQDIGMQIVSSGPDRKDEYVKYAYIKMINNAKKEIYIQTPYFIPDEPFLEAIRLAALSGVQIHIMIPGEYDKYLVYMGTLSFAHDLMECANVHFYRYKGFLHSKMVILDDKAVSIGTTNIDIRSFSLHFEINAFIFNRKFTKECQDIFFKDLENSEPFGINEYQARPWYQKLLESIMRLFAPIL